MTIEEKLNARSLTNTYPEHYGKIIPYDDLIKIKDALEIFQQQVSVEPVVKVQIAEILRMCEISLPNARLLNANTQYKNGWEDAFKHIIDYVNNLND